MSDATGLGERLRALLHRTVLRRDGMRGPIMAMLSGSMLASLLSVIALPVLARLYSPEDYGMLALFSSVVALVSPIGSLRYGDAMMLPRRRADAANVLWLSILVSATLTTLLVLLLPLRHEIADWKGDPTLATWLLFLPPTVLGLRLRSLLKIWLLRHNRFPVASSGDFANNLWLVALRVLGGLPLLYRGPLGLIGSVTVGHFATVAWYGRHTAWRDLGRSFSWRRIGELAVRYRRFPLLSMPSSLINASLSYLPVAIVAWAFGTEVSGQYWQAFITFLIPLTILAAAVQHVFFVRAAEAERDGNLPRLVADVYDRLVMIGLFPVLGALIVAPDVYAVVLGAEWRDAGEYLRVLAPWFFLAASCAPLTRIFDVREKQRADLTSSALMAALMVPAIWWGAQQSDIWLYLVALAASGVAGRLVQLSLMLYYGGLTLRQGLAPFARYAAFGSPFLLALWGVVSLGVPAATTVATALAGALFYGWMGARLGLLPARFFGR
jgi:O-antigen/teichoic acid export membrane protein